MRLKFCEFTIINGKSGIGALKESKVKEYTSWVNNNNVLFNYINICVNIIYFYI